MGRGKTRLNEKNLVSRETDLGRHCCSLSSQYCTVLRDPPKMFTAQILTNSRGYSVCITTQSTNMGLRPH